MHTITRRSVLGGTAAVLSAAATPFALPSLVDAAALQVGKQVPGYREIPVVWKPQL